jgi:hypothetical protein
LEGKDVSITNWPNLSSPNEKKINFELIGADQLIMLNLEVLGCILNCLSELSNPEFEKYFENKHNQDKVCRAMEEFKALISSSLTLARPRNDVHILIIDKAI